MFILSPPPSPLSLPLWLFVDYNKINQRNIFYTYGFNKIKHIKTFMRNVIYVSYAQYNFNGMGIETKINISGDI